jgi:hypothetical protein
VFGIEVRSEGWCLRLGQGLELEIEIRVCLYRMAR